MSRKRLLFNGYYPEAEKFINAAAITDETQKSAINYLVGELKKNNLWSKCYAIYPVIGGTSSTHKFNLLDPQDTDGAHRLIFSGTVTHNSAGMQGNGTTGYANTFFNPTTAGVSLNNFGFGVCSSTNQARLEVDIGARNTSTTAVSLIIIRNASNVSQHQINSDNAGTITQSSITSSVGHFANNRLNNTQLRVARNGTITVFTQSSGTLTDRNIALMALLTNTTYSSYSSKVYNFFRIHQGLSDSEETIFETIITNYNTILGR